MGISETLKVLSDVQRREILLLLRTQKRTAGSLAQELKISPAALSYHLRLLKQAGFVLEYREKNFIWYEINTTVFDELVFWIQQFRGEYNEEKQNSVADSLDPADRDGSATVSASGSDAHAL